MPLRKLFLFGVPRLEQDGQALPLPGRKLPALLAYLAATAQPLLGVRRSWRKSSNSCGRKPAVDSSTWWGRAELARRAWL